MRYYSIEIRDKTSGVLIKPRSFQAINQNATITSLIDDGRTNPAALNIELYSPIYNQATPKQGSWLRIWGIGIQEISQAADLEGATVIIKAGMAKGYPLAKPKQAGTIIQARAFAVFGNWEGVDQTLEMQLLPYVGTQSQPVNLPLDWKAGKPLGPALQTTLETGLKSWGYTVKMAISDQLVTNSDKTAIYGKLPDLSNWVRSETLNKQYAGIKTLNGAPYAGVDITIRDKMILVYDGTIDYGQNTASNPIQLAFEDFIGQPTWIGANLINFKTVMRADIKVGDYVKFPSGPKGQSLSTPYILTQPGAAVPGSPSRNNLNFQGVFPVREMIQYGNFRQADAASWCTSFNASAQSGK